MTPATDTNTGKDHWDSAGANLKLVYSPGSRASLKEKPYYEEVIEQLRRTKIALDHGEAPDESPAQ